MRLPVGASAYASVPPPAPLPIMMTSYCLDASMGMLHCVKRQNAVRLLINLDAVDGIPAGRARHVEEDPAVGQRAVVIHRVAHHDLLLFVPITGCDVRAS